MAFPDTPFTYRSAPIAWQRLAEWFAANPHRQPQHSAPWDVSRSDIYVQDCWQPIFADMRAKAPINKAENSPYGPYWNVTTAAAIMEVETQPELYSSSWRNGGITISDPLGDPDPELAARRQLPMFIAMDPPEHTAQRRTVAPKFTPGEVAKMEAEIRQRTASVLDGLPWGEQFDWVDRVSTELTTGMLAVLFGFPWEDRRLLSFWSDWAGDVEFALVPELAEERLSILGEMTHYFQRLWAERMHAEPAGDLISMMIHSEAMSAMSPQEFMANLVLLIVGGNDTTRNTMSGLVEALDQFADQRALFEADPGVIPNAVHEFIRYVTPLAHMRRTATADAELCGHTIRKGDKVVLWYISANRDEAVFTAPDQLLLTRDNARRHLAFGHGIHRCVGARLAELQLRVLLEEMHQRRMRPRVTGAVERVRANFVHGFRQLEVTLEKF